MLTKTQKKTYEFICNFYQKYHLSPTVDEIAKGIGIKSKGVAYRYLQALVSAKLLKLIPHRRRNIVLLKGKSSQTNFLLPLMGKIAAGKPIEAISDQSEIDLSQVLGFDDFSDRYALKVKGDSMKDEGIFDEDIVICEQCEQAQNGEIVVALIDNQEATLKRLQLNSDNTVTLWPANRTHKPITYSSERIRIQGKFIGLLRIMK